MTITFSLASSTKFGSCTTGDSRLGASSDSTSLLTREGRVEICINNAWGTVCDQNELFDSDDATVFCGQLTGFQSQGTLE